MNKKELQFQNLAPVFSEESGLIVGKILEKYGLIKIQNEGIKKICSPEVSPTERKEIFENLPGKKIAKLVRDYAEKKIPLESFPPLLEKELSISEKDARQMADDLKKTILDSIRWEKTPAEERITPRAIPKPKEEDVEEPAIPEKPETPPQKDIYREPIE